MKLLPIALVVLQTWLCSADISELLSAANSFEGYDYPKPKIPFETGFQKKLVVEKPATPRPTIASTYLPPATTRATTTRTTTTTTRPTPPPTYLPPVVRKIETTPRTTTKTTTTPKPTTTKPPVIIEKKAPAIKEGYDYPAPPPARQLALPPKASPTIASTYLPPATTRATTTTTRATTTTTKAPVIILKKDPAEEGYSYPKPEIPFFY